MRRKACVVDRYEDTMEFLKGLLEEQGYEAAVLNVYEVGVFEKIIAYEPDLILLTLGPYSQEHELLDQLLSSSETSSIPLLLFADSEKVFKEEEARLGKRFSNKLSRPYEVEELIEAVRKVLG